MMWEKGAEIILIRSESVALNASFRARLNVFGLSLCTVDAPLLRPIRGTL